MNNIEAPYAPKREETKPSRVIVEVPIEFGFFPSIKKLREIARTGESILSGRDDDRWATTVCYDSQQEAKPTLIITRTPEKPKKHGYTKATLITDSDMNVVATQFTDLQGTDLTPLRLDEPLSLETAIQQARHKESIRILQSFRHTHSLFRTAELTHHNPHSVMSYLAAAKRHRKHQPATSA